MNKNSSINYRNVLITLAFISVVGCATVQTTNTAHYETGHFPEVNEQTTVAVGSVMVSGYDFMSQSLAILRADVPKGFWAGRKGMAAGSTLRMAVSRGQEVYCEQTIGTGSPCFEDTDRDGAFDRVSSFNMYGLLVNATRIDPVPYTVSDRKILDGTKLELIYQGISNDVLRIAYREYSETLARPAFSQDLTYTLDESGNSRIQFREVSMVVHAADNNSVTYSVTKGFDIQR